MLKSKIRHFICEKTWTEESELSDDETLFSSGIIDSLDLLDLVAFIELELGIKIKASQLTLENFDTVNSMINFCKQFTVNEIKA